MATIPNQPTSMDEPQPAWDVALLFPSQGDWSEFDYLALDTRRLVELVDGNLEVLPMPAIMHQLIAQFLFTLLHEFTKARNLGAVILAPMPLRIRDKTFREPDVVLISDKEGIKPSDNFLNGARLAIEVVSPDSRSHKRDYEEKRADYAWVKVPEYWIVDPQTERITILSLADKLYRVHGEFTPGQQATSVLLKGFTVDVAAVFDAGQKLS
ncbi:MAG: Uma2 family endonuclease [Pirellulales bacterium]